jgi:hypothetical protein
MIAPDPFSPDAQQGRQNEVKNPPVKQVYRYEMAIVL